MNIVSLPELKVVGIRVDADWEQLPAVMLDTWATFRSRVHEVGGRSADELIDICLGREKGRYTQLICTQVNNVEIVPDGMTQLTVPRQTYIHLRHDGPLDEIASSFSRIYGWGDQNHYELDDFKLDIG